MRSSPQWEAVGDDLNSSVILGVNVVNVEVNDSGVGGQPGSCSVEGASSACVRSLLGHKLHGGRQRGSATAPAESAGQGKWASKTSKEQQSRGGKGRWSLGCWGWL